MSIENIRKKVYSVALVIPPLFALGMIFFTSFTSKSVIKAEGGLMLSPIKDTSPLILSLVIFFIGFLVFFEMIFKDSFEKLFSKKKTKKKFFR